MRRQHAAFLTAESPAEVRELRRLLKRLVNPRITVVALSDGATAAREIARLRQMEDASRDGERMAALRRNVHVLRTISACAD